MDDGVTMSISDRLFADLFGDEPDVAPDDVAGTATPIAGGTTTPIAGADTSIAGEESPHVEDGGAATDDDHEALDATYWSPCKLNR